MKQYAVAPEQPRDPPKSADRALDFLADVKLNCSVVLGNCTISIRNLLSLAPGSVLELGRAEGEPLEFRANGNPVARGEIVTVNDHYGIRITEVIDPGSREG